MDNNPTLSGDEIRKLVLERLKSYKNLSALEQYAMFMGKAQILEFGLKGLLTRKYGTPFDSMER